VAEGTHDVHLSHKILFSLAGRRLFQHFDSHNLWLLAVLSFQFTYNVRKVVLYRLSDRWLVI
jgi:hypothetical protein